MSDPRRICIVGAGAVGSWIGARLQAAGDDVVLVARGAHGAAMREHGLRVEDAGEPPLHLAVRVEEEIAAVDSTDLLVVCVKAHQLAPIAPDLGRLVRGGAELVAVQNGIPWWYLLGHAHAGPPLTSVDPGGRVAAALDPARTLGCVLYVSCTIVAPGVVLHENHNRFMLGRPNGACDPAAHEIAETFERAGLRTKLVPDIRRSIWEKLLGNLTFNPLSALTRSTMEELLAEDVTLDFIRDAMTEGVAVARALGDEPAVDVDARLSATPRNAFRTSMLQDVVAGRPLEVDAIASAVVELADRTRVAVPTVRRIAALARLLNASLARERREISAGRTY